MRNVCQCTHGVECENCAAARLRLEDAGKAAFAAKMKEAQENIKLALLDPVFAQQVRDFLLPPAAPKKEAKANG